MRKAYYLLAAGLSALLLTASTHRNVAPAGFVNGTPAIQYISALAFGPDGILFIGDAKSASVFAIDTKDKTSVAKAAAVDVKNIDQKIAAVLGTEAKKYYHSGRRGKSHFKEDLFGSSGCGQFNGTPFTRGR